MRILIWTDGFWPEIGGLEVFCVHLALRLREKGHECMVLTERYHDQGLGLSHYQGIPVFGVTFYRASLQRDLRSVRKQHELCQNVVRQFNPEVIHLNSVMRGALGFLLLQRDQRRPALLTLHDHACFQSQEGMVTAVLKNIDALAAVSGFVKNTVLQYQPFLADRLSTISNALPRPELLPQPFPAEPRLLAFGRMIHHKGFDLAIQAFARVAEFFPQATLTLAGQGHEYSALRQQAEASGFGHRIHFPGWIDPEAIPALINQHSLVIMPGRWQEPFGFVALQAAQMGRPLLASRTGGLPEIVQEGRTGKLFNNEDVTEMTDSLLWFLQHPELAEEMGRHAYAHARKNFSFAQMASAYEELYARLAL